MGRLSGTRSLTDISRLAQFTRSERATDRANARACSDSDLEHRGVSQHIDYSNGKGAYLHNKTLSNKEKQTTQESSRVSTSTASTYSFTLSPRS